MKAKDKITIDQMALAFEMMSTGICAHKIAHVFDLTEHQFTMFKAKVRKEGFAAWGR